MSDELDFAPGVQKSSDVETAANPPDSSADVVVRNTSGIAPVFA
jgi:hypothetical protein